eukprot:CAMPEP_0171746816 /NCGR_PEP_ID=MMETSP0991-20121206/39045_1 /TAXON_ID=483369 /ORGANISM="non described non described, Strain CCMP2098" /LENGTH=66 /DNA_ID=CAMNT_0012346679 /DNA_START=282 /DNA_END=482 /DNA_ORIENTATION=+
MTEKLAPRWGKHQRATTLLLTAEGAWAPTELPAPLVQGNGRLQGRSPSFEEEGATPAPVVTAEPGL